MARTSAGRRIGGQLCAPGPSGLFVGRDMAAAMLSVSTRTIDQAIKTGDLKAFRIGRRVVIHRDTLMKFATRCVFLQ